MVFIFIVERLFYNYYIQKHYLVNDFARSRLPFRQKFQCKKALAKAKLFDKAHGVSYIVFVCGYGEMADALVSGTSVRKDMGVQVPPSAPHRSEASALLRYSFLFMLCGSGDMPRPAVSTV